MSDAAPAITLGFQILFGDSKRGMCFFHKQCHVARNKMIPSLNEKNPMYIPFYSSPHLLTIDYKQAWLWRENLFDDDNKKKRKIITKCTFNEDVGANCRVFYTKSTIGRDYSREIDEWDVDEWNQFEEKKN